MIDPSAFTPPYDHHLSNGLVKIGCDVTLITTEFDYVGWEDDLEYEKNELFYQLTNSLYSSLDSSWHRQILKGGEHILNLFFLLRNLKNMDPDIIHFQWLPLPVVDQIFVERLKEIAPLVHTVHESKPYHGVTPSRIQAWSARSVPKKFDQLIVHTEEAKGDLMKRAIPGSKITVIPHGIIQYPHDEQLISESSRRLSDDENTVLFFGGIKEYKGIDVLLRAFSELELEIQEKTTLKIAGNPTMSIDELQELATTLGIQNHVDWDTRYIPDGEVPELFKNSDIVAFPYRTANQSGALMTALPYGKAIIASNVGGFAKVLEDGTHGHLVEPENPEALSIALEDILSNESKCNRMGEAVRDLATNTYSWNEIAKRTLEVYETSR